MSNTIKKTYQQISDFARLASLRLKSSDLNVENKLNSCLMDLLGNPLTGDLGSNFHIGAKYATEQKKIARKHASVDEKGNLLKDVNKDYVYTRLNEEACEKELADLVNSEVEITPSYCPADSLPQDLTPAEKKVYLGFVLE